METITVPSHVLLSMIESLQDSLTFTEQHLEDEKYGFPYGYGYLYSKIRNELKTLTHYTSSATMSTVR